MIFRLKINKKNVFWAIFWILASLLAFGLLLQHSFSYLDPDFGWHLKVGQEIAASGQVPHDNLYNFSYSGRWVDHEWLGDWLVYIIYDNVGYIALNIFFALLIIISLTLSLSTIKKKNRKITAAVVFPLTLFGLIASQPHFGVRLQEFGFFFLALELFLLERFRQPAAKKYWFIWPPLFWFWANIHGSWPLGLFLLGAWFVNELISGRLRRKDAILPLIWSGAALAATAFTPYGLELFSFLGGYRDNFYMKVIQEWLPQWNFPFNYPQTLYLALFLLLSIFWIHEIKKRRETLDCWSVFLAGLFFILSLHSRRHFPLFFLATLPLMSVSLSRAFSEIEFRIKQRWLRPLCLFCLFLSTVAVWLDVRPLKDPFSSFCGEYPCQAISWLQENSELSMGQLFNDYNWGGFLIWQYPERKIFIDGRLPQVPFAGQSFIGEYCRFLRSDKDCIMLLEQYGISVVMIRSQLPKLVIHPWEKLVFNLREKDFDQDYHLRSCLESAPVWERAYDDGVAVIYLKK